MRVKKQEIINPSFWLFCITIAAFYLSMILYFIGEISLPFAAVFNVVALYSMYSVTHDAIHGIASPSERLNGLMGRICAFHEGMTFPIFKISHMMHHGHTNHPQMDPDWIIGRKPRILLPLWVVIRLLHDNSYMIQRGLWRGKNRYLIEHLFTVVLQGVYFVALSSLFGTVNAFLLWVIPLATAGALVELLVAWLVHYPQESQHRLEHTRLIQSRILQFVMFNHNLHIVHHLWPRTPWFEYPKRLKDAKCVLELHSQNK